MKKKPPIEKIEKKKKKVFYAERYYPSEIHYRLVRNMYCTPDERVGELKPYIKCVIRELNRSIRPKSLYVESTRRDPREEIPKKGPRVSIYKSTVLFGFDDEHTRPVNDAGIETALGKTYTVCGYKDKKLQCITDKSLTADKSTDASEWLDSMLAKPTIPDMEKAELVEAQIEEHRQLVLEHKLQRGKEEELRGIQQRKREMFPPERLPIPEHLRMEKSTPEEYKHVVPTDRPEGIEVGRFEKERDSKPSKHRRRKAKRYGGDEGESDG